MGDGDKLKVYLETSFVSYLTGGATPNAKIAADQAYTRHKLIDGHALPDGETTDALHIATAAVNGMDVLLTWNCKHMANPHTLPRTRQIISAEGFFCPAIMTPKTFIENTQMEVDHV